MVLGLKTQKCDSQTGYVQHWVTSFGGSLGDFAPWQITPLWSSKIPHSLVWL